MLKSLSRKGKPIWPASNGRTDQKRGNMRKLTLAAVFAAIVGGTGLAKAQTYPSRPIMMIVPLATGGSTDTIGRIMAEGMRGFLGQPLILENLTAAGRSLRVGPGAR